MSMIFILIQNNFGMNINNDESLKTICEHKGEKKSWSSPLEPSNMEPKFYS